MERLSTSILHFEDFFGSSTDKNEKVLKVE